MREYKLKDPIHPEGGPIVKVKNDKDCIFCDHCTDVWWDYTHGPYMFFCEKHDKCIHGNCPDFKEEENGTKG